MSDSRRRLKNVIPGVGFGALGVGFACFLNSLFKNGPLVKSIVTGILALGHIHISAGPLWATRLWGVWVKYYNNHCFKRRLQTSKYIALLTSMLTASFSAFTASCNLFLCCYRATGSTFYHPRIAFPQNRCPPGIPSKSIDFSILFSSIFAPKMTLKMEPKSLKIHSRSHPETNPPKRTKIYRTKPLQTLKIELSCKRGASFHKFTISTKKQRSDPKTSKQ